MGVCTSEVCLSLKPGLHPAGLLLNSHLQHLSVDNNLIGGVDMVRWEKVQLSNKVSGHAQLQMIDFGGTKSNKAKPVLKLNITVVTPYPTTELRMMGTHAWTNIGAGYVAWSRQC